MWVSFSSEGVLLDYTYIRVLLFSNTMVSVGIFIFTSGGGEF